MKKEENVIEKNRRISNLNDIIIYQGKLIENLKERIVLLENYKKQKPSSNKVYKHAYLIGFILFFVILLSGLGISINNIFMIFLFLGCIYFITNWASIMINEYFEK